MNLNKVLKYKSMQNYSWKNLLYCSHSIRSENLITLFLLEYKQVNDFFISQQKRLITLCTPKIHLHLLPHRCLSAGAKNPRKRRRMHKEFKMQMTPPQAVHYTPWEWISQCVLEQQKRKPANACALWRMIITAIGSGARPAHSPVLYR